MRRISLLLALAAMGAFPAAAVAQDNSGIDQYVESVPGAGGDRTSGDGKGSKGGADLSPAVRAQLENGGSVGAAVAALADATAQSKTEGGKGGSGTGGGSKSGQNGGADGDNGELARIAATSDEPSGTTGLLSAVFGGTGGGMGAALPIVLIAALVAAVVAMIGRSRRRANE